MGLLSRRSPDAQPAQSPELAPLPSAQATLTPLPNLTRRSNAHDVARVLFARYGNDCDTDDLFDLANACDVDPKAVDDELWTLREEAEVKVVQLDPSTLRIMNLRNVDSISHRVVGISYWLTDRERDKFASAVYLLVREPKNEHDANAVAVYNKGRKVGHTTAARAALLAPLLDALGADAYRVRGDSSMTIRVPKPAALLAFAESRQTR